MPASSVTSSHSTRPSFSTEVVPPRCAPAKDPPYRLDGKKKTMCYIIFPQQRWTKHQREDV
ncbi:hypothetical protein C0J52_04754 [Blattella germanica]|nr:hypothetical protein C0J52_04754 [Blattella germanica]